VIGINAQIQSSLRRQRGRRVRDPVEHGLPRPSPQIVAGKTVAHAYLGVRVGDSALAARRNTRPGSAWHACREGRAESGDVVVKLDTKAIQSAADVSSVIDGKQPGDTMKVTLRPKRGRPRSRSLGTRPS
jgi:S1-C subfamily serine protease